MEIHLLKTTINLQKVILNVAFLGQLSFEFKSGLNVQKMSQQYPLVKHECLIETSYDKQIKQYSETIIKLIIYIHTAKNKLTVGHVSINAVANQELILPINKCSDKLASITLSVTHAKIKILKQIEDQLKSASNKLQVKLTKSTNLGHSLHLEKIQPHKSKKEYDNQKSNRQSMKQSYTGFTSKESKIQQIEDQYRIKYELTNQIKQNLESQLSTNREKLRLAERKEKTMETSLKQAKDISEKRRIKINDLQVKLNELQKSKDENEKRIKVFQIEQNKYEEQKQMMASKLSSLQRKSESKDQINRERQKKFEQKIKQLQNETSKATQDYNFLLQNLQTGERNRLNNAKTKEKNLNQQKVKMKQSIEKLTSQLQLFKQLADELTFKNEVFVQKQAALISKLNNLEKEYEEVKNAMLNFKEKLQKEQLRRKQLAKQMQQLNELQLDKSGLKKKLNQMIQENNRLAQEQKRSILENQQIKLKNGNMQNSLEQMKKQRKSLLFKPVQYEKIIKNQQKQIGKWKENTQQSQRENIVLKDKIQKLEDQSSFLMNNYQIQKEQYEHEMQQLQKNLGEMEQQLVYQQEFISNLLAENIELQKNILNLNKQLRNIILAWDGQKVNCILIKKQQQKVKLYYQQFQNQADQLDKKVNEIINSQKKISKDQSFVQKNNSYLDFKQTIKKTSANCMKVIPEVERLRIMNDFVIIQQRFDEIIKNQNNNGNKYD